MLRSLTARPDPAPAGPMTLPLALEAARIIVLMMVLVTVPLAQPHPGAGAAGAAVAACLAVVAVSGAVWLSARRHQGLATAALIVLGTAGGVLAGLSPLSTAIAVGCVAASAAGARLPTEMSLACTAAAVAAFLAAGLTAGAPAEALLGFPLAFIGTWALGLTYRAYQRRAEQAERMLAESHRAREAETQAAALAERARIAREIHDVLAHSLAAVSVNLEAAEGLLGELPAGSPELARAIECVGRAGAFTREGLAEARRAILALRGDAAPLAAQLAALAGAHRGAGGAPAGFSVTGPPRPVAADAALTLYRAAQEALTNARKHAPGQPVSLSLDFSEPQIALRVSNPLPAGAAGGPLAATGAGYGLTGLRERAALAGGTLTAGPADREWQVCLQVPA